VYKLRQAVLQYDLQTLLFDLGDIHMPSPNMEEDMEFQIGLSVKKILEFACLENLRYLALFGPFKQMLPNINFFVDSHDGRTTHKDELMFWHQSQNRPCKIIENPGQRHQDQ
jgi:hypothetical protein